MNCYKNARLTPLRRGEMALLVVASKKPIDGDVGPHHDTLRLERLDRASQQGPGVVDRPAQMAETEAGQFHEDVRCGPGASSPTTRHPPRRGCSRLAC